jgi:hypothetical protein
MIELSISDISKKPSLLNGLKDIAKIVNKKTKEVKGVFIPFEDIKFAKDMIKEIEFQKWYQRNKGLLEVEENYDELFEDVIDELGDRIKYD